MRVRGARGGLQVGKSLVRSRGEIVATILAMVMVGLL